MKVVKIKTADLIGAQLDWAVAMAGKEWETAHLHYPTMTLDPRFQGVRIIQTSTHGPVCQLVPNNPMRQDYQPFLPSQEWAHGGPIIERERIGIVPSVRLTDRCSKYWIANLREVVGVETGPTPLIAAMRAFVASKLGSEVEVPEAQS